MKNKLHDLVIIGGGVAGCSAALYASRRELSTLVLTKDIGGQLAQAVVVENYPGAEKKGGVELSERIKKQAQGFGAEFVFDEVDTVTPQDKKFLVRTKANQYESRAVILAFGKEPRKLGVPGEDQFVGKGVSYCATCDGPLFKNKVVAVVGGGNTALEAADYLSSIAKQVILIHRRDKFRAEAEILKRFQSRKNAQILRDTKVIGIKGSKFVEETQLQNVKSKDERSIKVDGVFVDVGYEVKGDFVKNLVEFNNLGEIKINHKGETKTPGIFAAGDVTPTPYKQAVIAASSGVVAALAAWEYIACQQVTSPDWECSKK